MTAIQPVPTTAVRIAPMRRRHLGAVLAIERLVYPSPWSRALFRAELEQPATRRYLVAHDGRELVGYAGLMVIVDEAHVTTVAVHPSRQRGGVGRQLLAAVLAEGRSLGAKAATLEVRESNHAARRLYASFGFVDSGRRRRYYEGIEDALIMWLHPTDDATIADEAR